MGLKNRPNTNFPILASDTGINIFSGSTKSENSNGLFANTGFLDWIRTLPVNRRNLIFPRSSIVPSKRILSVIKNF